ncbi:MAG: YcbK family protein [Hyphomicrobiaceae bacterium]
MSERLSHRRLAAWARILASAAAGVLIVGTIDIAKADTPEYWMRETFPSARADFNASLSSDDDDDDARPARRRAPRASVVRSHRQHHARSRHSGHRKSHHGRQHAHKGKKNVRVASLGRGHVYAPKPTRSVGSGGGGSIRWVASSSCLNGNLRNVLAQVAAHFGSVTVNSTCRSRSRNARVGGARRSMHLTGNAADFRIHGNRGAASSFIRNLVGGFKHYGGGLFHIDTGPRRTW